MDGDLKAELVKQLAEKMLLLEDKGYHLGILALQSRRYQNDPEFQNATDEMLELTKLVPVRWKRTGRA